MTDTSATDTSASSAFPQPQGHNSLDGSADAQDGITPQSGDGWETVAFPGQLSILDTINAGTDGLIAEAGAGLVPEASADDSAPMAGAETTELAPEHLVQLIQDLNQCNDALLMRVTDLEEALERSQVALQSEIERHQVVPGGLPVGPTPGPVQQQIAQLLSELDIANDGLRRTTIHNETLQAELDASQQRVAQLERECTLLQQRFSEKNMALHQAEETCRDLKARLHRQQRYTLQFKAALEKCLNMAPSASAVGSGAVDSASVVQGQLLTPPRANEASQPVTMPRSQQIQPWSAGADSPAQPPNLTQLLRGLRSGGSGPLPLRVEAGPQSPLPPSLDAAPALIAETSAVIVPPAPSAVEPEAVLPDVVPDAPDPWLEETAAIAAVSDNLPAPLFTEPSPWGEPIALKEPAPAPPENLTSLSPASNDLPPAPAPSLSAADQMSGQPPSVPTPAVPVPAPAVPTLPAYLSVPDQASPSPLVYPLRSQKKKIKSIAAVELPSFGRNVRRR